MNCESGRRAPGPSIFERGSMGHFYRGGGGDIWQGLIKFANFVHVLRGKTDFAFL